MISGNNLTCYDMFVPNYFTISTLKQNQVLQPLYKIQLHLGFDGVFPNNGSSTQHGRCKVRVFISA